MPFTACQNSKYFRFYGTFSFSRNLLRMPCFIFLLPTIAHPIFDNFLAGTNKITFQQVFCQQVQRNNHLFSNYSEYDFISMYIFSFRINQNCDRSPKHEEKNVTQSYMFVTFFQTNRKKQNQQTQNQNQQRQNQNQQKQAKPT